MWVNGILRKNEKGYAFLLVFLTMILVSVLGLGILSVSNNTLTTSAHERDDQSVYYIAEAGLNYGREHFNQSFDNAFNKAEKDYLMAKANYEQNPIGDPPIFGNYLMNELSLLGYPTNIDIEVMLTNTFVNIGIPFQELEFETQFNNIPEASISITLINEDVNELQYAIKSIGKFYILDSTGQREDTSISRTLEQNIKITLDYTDTNGGSENGENNSGTNNGGSNGGNSSHYVPSEFTVQTKGNIIVKAGGKIDGNVASAGGNISLTGGASITGSIGTSPENFHVDNDGLEYLKNQVTEQKDFPAGNVLAPFPSNIMNDLSQLNYPPNEEVAESQWNKTNIINNGNFQADNWMTNNYTLNLTEDTHFKQFKVTSNNTITINVGDTDKDLYIESLDILQGHINIIGTGKLNIYVKDSFNIKGSFNSGGDVSQINFLYSGSVPLTFSNETQINGSLYAKEADLTFSGGVGVKGNIYSGGQNVTFDRGFNSVGQHIIAPNADIRVNAGAHIKGAVVADNIIVDGGASITFGESTISPGNNGGSNNSGGNNNSNVPPSPPKKNIIEEIILEK
ncbi:MULTISPECIES: DUF7305 domain-containing protein [Lysinibacillus]|uniref:DUF7305 domain-containing protein n=1 Tax=Lysinibacillus TaxID=400634 RepID=UPI00257B8DA9|nr:MULTISPECIES: hypothetical protein [Lysinibacillus]